MHDHHNHTHDHDHGKASGEPIEKLLLAHMLDHNRQHAAELSALADKLDTAGNPDAAAHVRTALTDYTAGNEKLATALDALLTTAI
ncbi:MAG: hypothetical protein FWH32_01625 [Clostridiales bacterium]|nr:hypothetical protein [Clostridiales bacterium]